MFSNGIGFNKILKSNSASAEREVIYIRQSDLNPNTGRYTVQPSDKDKVLLVMEPECPIEILQSSTSNFDEIQILGYSKTVQIYKGDNVKFIQNGAQNNEDFIFLPPGLKAIFKRIQSDSSVFNLNFEAAIENKNYYGIFTIVTGPNLIYETVYSNIFNADLTFFYDQRDLFITGFGIDLKGLFVNNELAYNPLTQTGFIQNTSSANGEVIISYFLSGVQQDLSLSSVQFKILVNLWN